MYHVSLGCYHIVNPHVGAAKDWVISLGLIYFVFVTNEGVMRVIMLNDYDLILYAILPFLSLTLAFAGGF